jgi:hypothetical protein
MRGSAQILRLRAFALPELALAAALLLCPKAGLAVETQWRFDGAVSFVGGTWVQQVAVGAPVHGLVTLDRDPPYVQIGGTCDSELYRIFHSVRTAQFSMPGASGAATTPVLPGVDCAPDVCDVKITLDLTSGPPTCSKDVIFVDIDSGPVASPELGDVDLAINLEPMFMAPAFYLTIPDLPWPAVPGGILGQIQPAGVPVPQEFIEFNIAALVRAPMCGDIDLDLDVDSSDVSLVRTALANPTGAPLPAGGASRCSVIGGADDCDVRDVAVIRRTLASPPLGPGIQQVCASLNGG